MIAARLSTPRRDSRPPRACVRTAVTKTAHRATAPAGEVLQRLVERQSECLLIVQQPELPPMGSGNSSATIARPSSARVRRAEPCPSSVDRLAMVADELPDPIEGSSAAARSARPFGLPLHEALKNFARRVPLLDARFFVTAVLTQREAGGNLSEVLDNLAAIIRDRFRRQRQVRVLWRTGASRLGAGLPGAREALVSVFLMPANYEKFYRDPLGFR